MTVKKEILGKDKKGKLWYVLIEEEDDIAEFYVFPEENIDKDVMETGNHVMKGVAKKLETDVVVVEDFLHPDVEAIEFLNDRLESLTSPFFKNYIIEVRNGSHKARKGKWEGRRIGNLLLKRMEEWGKESGAKKIIGFLSPKDDIDRLTKMYSRWGYEVRMYRRGEKKPKGYGFAVGIVTKLLSSEDKITRSGLD